MARNEAAALGQVCPDILIQAIDMVQPPGIGIAPIADIDVHQMIVSAVLTTKSNAQILKNIRSLI
jgi:hypothetical protein